MRTTVTLDETVVAELQEAYGIRGNSELVQRALQEMRQRLAADRLIALGGSDPTAKAAPRRRPPNFTNPD
jgi:Arc/MetJ family transcription regulator